MKSIALILAAGKGLRTGLNIPKQYIEIAGKSILRRAIDAFLRHPEIDTICVVIGEDDLLLYEKAITGLDILPPIVGGVTRQESVQNGLESLVEHTPDSVLIHDAARPFISRELISRCLSKLNQAEAVLPSIAITDSLKSFEGDLITGALNRDEIVAAQTPQAFAFAPILAAHRTFAGENLTDDTALAERAGIEVAMVEGDPANFKITTPEDIEKAHNMITKSLIDVRTGLGFDVHAFEEGDSVWLGGVSIPYDKRLKGHSDADVALHALTDALLGAIGAGDIGLHFPPTDAKWKGASSDLFLRHAADLVGKKGGVINHVDLTIICEAPRIGPHRVAMQKRIAETLRIDAERVSIKGTTTEKLGFTGRGEGIAAQAVVTVRLPG
ncbi:bifunctional 2-C-methyl-D-erythritol 4-phosphate cytidylyltransferase/2-C-methyl-D-erythritol 2,4-cyclodiphosphate synthase [Sneathiella sp. HT1-7]|uniref:bifunctional 2-C-methyl-D-erythritol 4-phosphate cytidylyltransferase/2-C-methyl-D-erythritol 2,4-cyclodiphosphate synthase n=1 Tax=Sneathiella sp. HT1-7 TaxID=2887192 RepID=UPI001D15DF79|nr:bifunctional 2-C-methyl-D-erythritol 4-phosphate cytidylyltransferase/2-C-methyl-D-erythritol 2,4-cyclodiphosphate synthase [Sneathiella sp. HT1-7]MCC3306069.1 bifunctional 2-C-methyl-D-erythritol 4-phosphate cytidylyltransferase/2-C-methyl-D-erythritol 2,4-cyclodiphosphate synthase [Sneathiella sp. HT1-7]